MGSKWSKCVAWTDHDFLHLRVEAMQRLCLNWADPAIHGYGVDSSRPVEWDEVNAPLGALCFVVNELLRQLEYSLVHDLDIALVSGSRTLLSDDMASADWFSAVLEGTAGVGFTVADYARWLAQVSIDEGDRHWSITKDFRKRDDFVNDCLRTHLFAARRYQVKAEVIVREERLVLPRDGTQSIDPRQSMKSTLYLTDEQDRTLDFSQVGSGVSYVLPVLTALWGADRSLIEQPELHLHPAAQCEMGDAIVRAFNRGRFSIVETHSEHLLLRILRRVRQTSEGKVLDRELQCQPEAIAVLYFSPQPDGSTQVHQLRVTRGGDFMDRWPDGFFEERSRELFDE